MITADSEFDFGNFKGINLADPSGLNNKEAGNIGYLNMRFSSFSPGTAADGTINGSKLVDNSVQNIKLADLAITDPKIQSMNYNKLISIPTSFPSKTSMITANSNLDIGNYKYMKNGNEVIGLSTNSVATSHIGDNAVLIQKFKL